MVYYLQKQPPEVFCKKGVLRNFAKFTGKHLCQSLFFSRPQPCNFIKKGAVAQVFSCEFCEISRSTFFYRTPLGECSCACPILVTGVYSEPRQISKMELFSRIVHVFQSLTIFAKDSISDVRLGSEYISALYEYISSLNISLCVCVG